MVDLSSIDSLLITGTNGFVGRSIIDRLASTQEENLPKKIVLLTRRGIDFQLSSNLEPITKLIEHDLTREWNFVEDVSHIINLAADGSSSSYSLKANEVFSSIVSNLVAWVSNNRYSPRIFHASSGACSGFKPLIGSDYSQNPKASFAANRLRAECTLINASKQFKFELSIGRLFTFSGTHLLQKNQYAITNFIRSAISLNEIRIQGNPNTVRSYLHQDEMANWILTALISEKVLTHLEIGSSEEVTIKELASFIAQETSASIRISTEPHVGDIYLPNNQETKDKLGVTEGISWKEAVVEMIKVEGKKINGTF